MAAIAACAIAFSAVAVKASVGEHFLGWEIGKSVTTPCEGQTGSCTWTLTYTKICRVQNPPDCDEVTESGPQEVNSTCENGVCTSAGW